jgi:hypothetical protein
VNKEKRETNKHRHTHVHNNALAKTNNNNNKKKYNQSPPMENDSMHTENVQFTGYLVQLEMLLEV